MALNQRKWQKKVERKKAKQRERHRSLIKFQSLSMADRIEHAAAAPILHCRTSKILWMQGMSHVLVSRKLSSGNIAFSAFLLDIYCLGVKDAFCDLVTPRRYEELIDGMFRDQEVDNLKPAAARKLVEGAVDYAQNLGFAPHPDYRKARVIFGDIDAGECHEEFEFGKRGRPCFVPGPYDTPWRCKRIVDTLTERLGIDGFTYVLTPETLPVILDDFLSTGLLDGENEEEEDEEVDVIEG